MHEFACELLQLQTLPHSLEVLFEGMAQGSPLFCAEVAAFLQNRPDLIRVQGLRVVHLADEETLQREVSPAGLETALLERVDRLGTTLQLVLKVSAVLAQGQTVGLALLQGVCDRVGKEGGGLSSATDDASKGEGIYPFLTELLDQRLLVPSAAAEPSLSLCSGQLQRLVYASVPALQRRQLHRAAAEEGLASGIASIEMLAYHWAQAGDAARALPYLLSAAERADTCFAHRERAHFYNEALRVSMSDGADAPSDAPADAPALAAVTSPGGRRLSASVPSWQLAQWHYEVGRSEWSLGRLQKTTEELQRAMELLGRPNVAISDQREASVSGFLTSWRRRAAARSAPRRGSASGSCSTRRPSTPSTPSPSSTRWARTPSGRAPTPSSSPPNARVRSCCASATERSPSARPTQRTRRSGLPPSPTRSPAAVVGGGGGGGADDGGDGDGASVAGFLEKKSRQHGGYQRRWFVLDRAGLSYFREPPRFAPPTVIDLSTLVAPPKPTHPTALFQRATRAARRGRRRGRRRARGRTRTASRSRPTRDRTRSPPTPRPSSRLGCSSSPSPSPPPTPPAAPAADAAAGSRRSLKVEGDDAPRPSRSASLLIAAPTEGDLAPKLTVGAWLTKEAVKPDQLYRV